MNRGLAKTRTGVVVSNKMNKTVVVMLTRFVKHRKFGKHVRLKKNVKAHDEKNECKVGDEVSLVETKPISKDKRWRVREIVSRSADV